MPDALVQIGGPAHQDLLHAIDTTSDPMKRMYLIVALQHGFHDWSRFDVVLQDVAQGRISNFFVNILFWADAFNAFPGAPPLVTDAQLRRHTLTHSSPGKPIINPAFLAWWASHRQSAIAAAAGR